MGADFGPQQPWPVRWTCDVMTESPAITGFAVDFATDILWAKTGMRFGTTQVTLRPCRRSCWPTPYPGNVWKGWPGSSYGPPPYGGSGSGWVIGAGCSACGDSCSCTALSEIRLPSPVNSIVQVKQDGVIISGSGYRVDDNRSLVRLGGTWPYCQNLNLDDTQPGTLSVTVLFGEDVPGGAAGAVGQLACEILKAFNDEDCSLPPNVISLARQGVNISMPDLSTVLDTHGTFGLRLVDWFISTFNPHHITDRARVYSVDGVLARRQS